MRDKMERFVVLPFSAGCISNSSVAVAAAAAALSPPPRRSKPNRDSCPQEIHGNDDHEEMKNAFKFLALSKPETPNGIHRLFKSIKTISHLFAYKEEMEEEYERSGMEIGFPTDVKHVSHIGWEEGPVMTTTAKSVDDLLHLIPPELLPHHTATKQDLRSALLDPST